MDIRGHRIPTRGSRACRARCCWCAAGPWTRPKAGYVSNQCSSSSSLARNACAFAWLNRAEPHKAVDLFHTPNKTSRKRKGKTGHAKSSLLHYIVCQHSFFEWIRVVSSHAFDFDFTQASSSSSPQNQPSVLCYTTTSIHIPAAHFPTNRTHCSLLYTHPSLSLIYYPNTRRRSSVRIKSSSFPTPPSISLFSCARRMR
jgi:hypothetical protein